MENKEEKMKFGDWVFAFCFVLTIIFVLVGAINTYNYFFPKVETPVVEGWEANRRKYPVCEIDSMWELSSDESMVAIEIQDVHEDWFHTSTTTPEKAAKDCSVMQELVKDNLEKEKRIKIKWCDANKQEKYEDFKACELLKEEVTTQEK